MTKILDSKQFLEQAREFPVVDVRSPKEFAQGHIPGAINIPIFKDEERARVGTRYKKVGRDSAIVLGLEIVGPKMAGFVKWARKVAKEKKILIHCWRGGMRSESMAWLFEKGGLDVSLLEGGYKAYRHYIRSSFEQKANIVILGGMTGSGKTEILEHISKQGQQVMDLEGVAHHRGSAFGYLGQEPQPTNEQFENNLYMLWREFNLAQPIWLEDESLSIGAVGIPDPLFKQMRQSPVVAIKKSKALRIDRLVREYAVFSNEDLLQAVSRIKKKLGGQQMKRAEEAIEASDYAYVADITLTYYDKAYQYGQSQREALTLFPLQLENDDAADNAQRILAFADTLFSSSKLMQHQ